MHTELIRINVTLPKDILDAVNSFAGPRARSRFIAESIRERILNVQKAALEKQLEEGYSAAAKDSIAVAKEFEGVDLEGWDEY